MEKQTVTVTVKTEGDNCPLSDEEIACWYREHITALFDARYGAPEISVTVSREEV